MKKDYSFVLLDLDGTITDSGPGIMNGFEYAIKKMGGEVKDRSSLRRFIGPPLEESFGVLLGYSPEDTAKAIGYYRDYYFNRGGINENTVYPGIEIVLSELKGRGKKLLVATTKIEKGAKLVIEHFGLGKYFAFISAANSTDRKTKAQVIRYGLEEAGCTDISKALMIGDRHYDIEGAKEVGLDSVGALWGYGSREELKEAGATYLLNKPGEILNLFR